MSILMPGTATVIAQVKKQSVNSSKKVQKSDFELVLGFARKKFMSFPVQTTEIKAKLLDAGTSLKGVSKDAFYGDFANAVSMLLESTKFLSDCESNHLCPLNVAQHTVFAGMSYVIGVLKNGLDATFKTIYLPQMKDAIISYDELKKYDGNHRLQDAMEFEKILTKCKEGKYSECTNCPRHKELASAN